MKDANMPDPGNPFRSVRKPLRSAKGAGDAKVSSSEERVSGILSPWRNDQDLVRHFRGYKMESAGTLTKIEAVSTAMKNGCLI